MGKNRVKASAVASQSSPPRLRDGLAVYLLEGSRVRIGVTDPVILDNLSPNESAFVASLEGHRPRSPHDSVPFAHVVRTLERLGLLHEDNAGSSAPRESVPQTSVSVIGADRLGAAVALCLAQAGIGRILVDDSARFGVAAPADMSDCATAAQATVRSINSWVSCVAKVATPAGSFSAADVCVIVANGSPDVQLTHDLMAADQPHLPIVSDEQGVTVGPLIVPGDGPCLTCIAIERTEADPDWPFVALQCSSARQPLVGAAVRALAAGVACDSVLRFLDGRRSDPRRWRIECDEPGGPRVVESVVSAHPACGCGDPLMLGHNLQDVDAILL